MASKKTLAQRLFNICKTSSKSLTNYRRIPSRASLATDPGDCAIFSRFLHKRAVQPATSPELRSLPTGEGLIEKIKEIGIARDRLRLDGLTPPEERPELTVEDTRKLLRAAQLEAVKSRLREIQKIWIPYSEFVRICGEGSSSPDQGRSFAKMLDVSGTVIVFGDCVVLRPEQVSKVIQALIQTPEAIQALIQAPEAIRALTQASEADPNDPRRKELEEMEKQKSEIDKKADSLVWKELYCGFGFLVVQTAGFMRLTFWELSWDVMEPICYNVASIFFIACYAFFLRTRKEPSFEGFFQGRFGAKQKRLMKVHNFDIERYNELKKACNPRTMSSLQTSPPQASSFDKSEKVQWGVLHH